MSRRALFVYNPVARRAPSLDRLRDAVAWLGTQGWETSLEGTTAAMHATELAREAARKDYDVVVACGGDGTVSEVANGLADSSTALAVMPGGTANVWAKEVRIPRKPLAAMQVIAEGERRRIDLGLAFTEGQFACGGNHRYFLLMTGVGLDGLVVGTVPDGLKRRLGAGAYVLHGLRHILSYRSRPTHLVLDGQPTETELFWMVVGNTRSYGGVVSVTHQAVADDGRLDLCLFSGHGLPRLIACGLRILVGRHHRAGNVLYRAVESVEVREPALPVQADGEYLGETPMSFRAVAGALHVVVPRGLRSPLFTRDSVAVS
jgi:diacylglycerol kinase (ATP)